MASPASNAPGSPTQLRKKLGSIAAPLLFALIALLPLNLERDAQWMAAICASAIVLWITEAIPLAVTAMAAPAVAVLCGVAPVGKALAPFAHPLIFLFMGGFLLARAISVHQIDVRLALWLVSRSLIAGSPQRAFIAICLIAFVLSMWVSNTATAAMMLPIVTGILAAIDRALPDGPGARERLPAFREISYIALAYACSLGGLCTPIGTAPNLLGIDALARSQGQTIDFLQWMQFGFPAGFASLILCIFLGLRIAPPPKARVQGFEANMRAQLEQLGPMSPAARRVIAVFLLAVCGWLAPSFIRLSLGAENPLYQSLKTSLAEGNVALLCALILFALPQGAGERKPLLEISDLQKIDWSTLYLLGGGIALGRLAFSSGLAEVIGQKTVQTWTAHADNPQLVLLLVSCALVLVLTEFTSNVATTNMMLPVLLSICESGAMRSAPVVIGVSMAASFAFVLPVSTPPNAIVYGSGEVRLSSMFRYGVWMDLGGYLILLTICILLLPLLGLG